MADRLQITTEELRDPRVDARLAEEQGFGFARSEEVPVPFWFRPWFALAVAGLLGALAAWALLEPFFDDGIRAVGRIESIHEPADDAAEGVLGAVRVGEVWLIVTTETALLERDRSRLALEALRPGEAVEFLFRGEEAADDGTLWAFAGSIQRTDRPAGELTLSSLGRQSKSNTLVALLLFPLIAALVGMFVGAADGALSRAWARAATSGAVGLAVGFFGGLVALIPSGMVYGLGSSLARGLMGEQEIGLHGHSLLVQIMGRGLAWAILGAAAGMGQGIALRSRRIFWNGVIGGTVGALLGGMLFDPVEMVVSRLVPTGGAEASRAIGFALLGAGVGALIGVVELAVREAWLRVLSGPIAGKEFSLFRDPTWIGSSPKSEIFLFKDASVAPRHAAIERVGEHFELVDQGTSAGTLVQGIPVRRRRLRQRDRIQVGATLLEFRVRDE